MSSKSKKKSSKPAGKKIKLPAMPFEMKRMAYVGFKTIVE